MSEEEFRQLKQNIGMLRQYLNESLKYKLKELITNEDIESWILNNIKKPKG